MGGPEAQVPFSHAMLPKAPPFRPQPARWILLLLSHYVSLSDVIPDLHT